MGYNAETAKQPLTGEAFDAVILSEREQHHRSGGSNMITCHNNDCPHNEAETNNCTKSEVEISKHGCSVYQQFKLDRQAEKARVKLKHCPFCGGTAELLYDFIGDGCYVICENACVMTDRKKDIKEVSDLWNNRRTLD